MADSKLTALSEISVPALEDLLYWVDDPSGTPASVKLTATRLGGLLAQSTVNGRLTTESGVPISTSDRSAQGTIYFTPYNGNRIGLYDGTRWRLYTFSEFSLALSSLTSGKNYDVFVYDNSGTLTLELSAAWTNDTTRADAIALQDGVYVKSGATTRRLVGTIRTTGTTTTEDSGGGSTTQVGGKRFVWNLYNQVPRFATVFDGTDSWTYSTNTWRQANGASGNKIELVCGLASLVRAVSRSHASASAGGALYYSNGVGVDSTSTNSAQQMAQGTTDTHSASSQALYVGYLSAGYHAVNWLEISQGAPAGTTTWYGDAGIPEIRTGLMAEFLT